MGVIVFNMTFTATPRGEGENGKDRIEGVHGWWDPGNDIR